MIINVSRSCEKTLQLLRDNHEALLTILEVLLCDPLYTWTITPAEAKRKQNLTATPRDTNNGMCMDTIQDTIEVLASTVP